MSPDVLGFIVFIWITAILVVPVVVFMRRGMAQTERDRRRKGWGVGSAGATGIAYGSGGIGDWGGGDSGGGSCGGGDSGGGSCGGGG